MSLNNKISAQNKRDKTGFKYAGNRHLSQRPKGSILKAFKTAEYSTEDLPNTLLDYNNANENMRGDIQSLMDRMAVEEQVKPVTRADGFGATDIAGGDWVNVSTKALMKFEGFKSNPYDDRKKGSNKPVWRIGYGSDKYMERGKIFPVTQNTKVNKAQAKQDLNRRIKTDFLPIIKNNIGDSWDGLSNNAKGAIMSITYNYGRVPKRIRAAINTGNTDKISAAIRSLAKDDEGINKNRRLAEAELVMLPDFNSDSLMKKRNK